MKQLFGFMKKKNSVKRRTGVGGSGVWMRSQLTKMQKMNQGVISMYVGK